MDYQFENVMSQKTDDELTAVVYSRPGEYHPNAIAAAEQEINNRQTIRNNLSKCSDEKILEILHSSGGYQPYEKETAQKEATKRNIHVAEEKAKAETIAPDHNQQTTTNHQRVSIDHESAQKKYPALRFISGVYRFFAWVSLLLSIGTFFYTLSEGKQTETPFGYLGTLIAFGILLGGLFVFISLLAIAEAIKLFIDMEHNTRISAMK